MLEHGKLAPWVKSGLHQTDSAKSKICQLLHAINCEGMDGRAQGSGDHETLADIIIGITKEPKEVEWRTAHDRRIRFCPVDGCNRAAEYLYCPKCGQGLKFVDDPERGEVR
jgi:hypothetical protein